MVEHDSASDAIDPKLDLDGLIQKLERYKVEVEVMADRLKRQRSFSAKEVADVTAATRFRLELERLEETRFEEESDPKLPRMSLSSDAISTTSTVEKEEGLRSHEGRSRSLTNVKKRRILKPLDLHLANPTVLPQEVQSARLPPRTSSKLPISDLNGTVSYGVAKSHRRCVTVSEDRHSTRLVLSSPDEDSCEEDCHPVAMSVHSTSTITSESSQPPATPVSLYTPEEDQIRRELETFAIQAGAEILDVVKYRRRRPPRLQLLEFDDESEESRLETDERLTTPTLQVGRHSDESSTAPFSPVTPSPRLRRTRSFLQCFPKEVTSGEVD